jgi:hypothetical protein
LARALSKGHAKQFGAHDEVGPRQPIGLNGLQIFTVLRASYRPWVAGRASLVADRATCGSSGWRTARESSVIYGGARQRLAA